MDEKVEARDVREEFPCLGCISIGSIVKQCWTEVHKTADEILDSGFGLLTDLS
jgi:hypothetical protein